MFKESVALTSSTWPNKALQPTRPSGRAAEIHTLGGKI